MSTSHPTVPIIKTAVCEPMIHPRPAKITSIIINSVIKCPNIIRGSALNPFFTESDRVTVSMGPGTNAPDNPTPNEVKANSTISIN